MARQIVVQRARLGKRARRQAAPVRAGTGRRGKVILGVADAAGNDGAAEYTGYLEHLDEDLRATRLTLLGEFRAVSFWAILPPVLPYQGRGVCLCKWLPGSHGV